MVQKMPRSAYPRPDFRRDEWKCLNGLWDFSFDEPRYDQKILVPFAPESRLSGLAYSVHHHDARRLTRRSHCHGAGAREVAG